MTTSNKKKIIQEVQGDIYKDYVKNCAVYKFLTVNYAKDLSEDEEKLRQELRDIRILAKGENEKLSENRNEESLKEMAVKIANLEGRIDFVKGKKDQVEKVKVQINEIVSYYDMLDLWQNNEFVKAKPKKII